MEQINYLQSELKVICKNCGWKGTNFRLHSGWLEKNGEKYFMANSFCPKCKSTDIDSDE